MKLDKFVEEKKEYYEIIGHIEKTNEFLIKYPDGRKKRWGKEWTFEQESEGNIQWINPDDDEDLKFKFQAQQEEVADEDIVLF